MQEQKQIIDCYDKVAENYAQKFIDELEEKPLDKILLKAFAEHNKEKGKLIDFGCGPGQTTKYLYDCGVADILGTDLSSEMVKVARKLNPEINFEVADMLDLKFAKTGFSSAIAFYAIVNFDYNQIRKAFQEIKHVLIDKGELLFSFHAGNETLHLDNFLEKEVDIKFQFFEPPIIKELLIEEGFEIIDIIIRQPYATEHPTERAYFWGRS